MSEKVSQNVVKHGVEPRPVQAEKSGQGLEERIEKLCEAMQEYDVNEFFNKLEELNFTHLFSDDDTIYIIDNETRRIIQIDNDFRDYRILNAEVSSDFLKHLRNGEITEVTDISFLAYEGRDYIQIDYNTDEDVSGREVIFIEEVQ